MSDTKTAFSLFTVHDHYPEEPRTVAEYYQETLDQIVLGEDLGFEAFWVAEHHFHEYGTIPNPAVFLAAAAQRTSKIGLGVAVSVLPFHDPLIVAEDYTMVDILSGGRLLLGVGSGYLKHEFDGFGISGKTKREHFDEKVDLVRRAMSGERITHKGEFCTLEDVAINVEPVQKPHPTLYMAALRKETPYFVGKQGYAMLAIPYANVLDLTELKEMIDDYERGWAEGGFEGPAPDIGFAFHTYVAESDAAAREEAEGPYMNYVNTRLYGRSTGWDEIQERRYSIMGGVDTCVERIREMNGLGIRNIVAIIDFGGLGREKTERSIRLLAEEVVPQINGVAAAAE